MHEIQIPKMGQSTVDVDITKWHVKVGDSVKPGMVIVEIESEKTTLEIESDIAGVVVALLAAEGETLEVGSVICRIELTS